MEILLSQSMEYRKRQKYAAVQIVKKLFLLSLMVKGEPNAKNPLLNFLYVFRHVKICIKNRILVSTEGIRGFDMFLLIPILGLINL